ncbi:cold shock domain-containing protein 3-like [Hevea brasiliensis]|uniref:cold shock domain-containing protein 3-like n=1 Tax=Hevea brasiliensis TaxID=3981 RepID=UPI0025DDD07E|nr:cold shock domain-containing protein 3-like [Hevea brasiliensis]
MEKFSHEPQCAKDIKFDASQYEFFGKNVVDYELGGFEEAVDNASAEKAQDHQDLQSSGKQKVKEVASSSFYINDLAISFTRLNRISEPRRDEKRVPSSTMEMRGFGNNRRRRGTVKWYNNQRGYGFITPNDGGADVFVHYSSLKSDGCIHLSPGTLVEYESVLSASDAKMQAINVTAPGGRLLQDSRKAGLGEATTTSSNAVGPCFNCGEWGHIAKNCSIVAQGHQGGSVWFGFASCCYCGKMGHLANNCPY